MVNPSLNTDIKDFEFLLNFENLTLPQKLEKLTQYFSHEVNIYLYFHHYDFFIKYIYPIIKYKSEKTFIDYFLINDMDNIKQYSNVQFINNLNVFEKCLLIYSIRKDNKKLSQSIARQIRAECPKEDENELKRLFNIAINLKSQEESKKEKKLLENLVENEEIHGDDNIFSYKSNRNIEMPMECEDDDMMDYDIDECCCCLKEEAFEIPIEFAEEINMKAQIFKEEGKSKEYCETQYYNQVYKDNNYKNIISPNHFFADLAQFWAESDSLRNIGFKSDNILIKPNNITELIFILSVLDLEEKTII